jgi:two-component system phosphate regulon response regulator PhoB
MSQPAGESGGRLLRAGPLSVDVNAHQVKLHGEEVSLTPTEFRLLQALLERRGRTQSRRQLLERAWDVESEISDRIQTRTVDMHIRRLRAKLGEVGDWVETVRGFGYRLRVPDGEH